MLVVVYINFGGGCTYTGMFVLKISQALHLRFVLIGLYISIQSLIERMNTAYPQRFLQNHRTLKSDGFLDWGSQGND